ncbi:L-fucose/L-arabinose isomerase family protein [Kiritimatiella glycovorans]|uniref:L-fucose isomerase n=1 Tax=Kiritimatiella glycovorans TaxID=1307763 RepID=A0A0G3EBI9_9BACT|nr:fucose isomerase [Kiritimatiella glycovorans]AKJ63673.1 L-fucose isomerase [Kiritimatiella glycovorans]
MRKTTPRLGLCPIGKFAFSHEDAVRQKEALREMIARRGVDAVDLEGVLDDGLVRDKAHVDTVVDHFRAQGVDALFIPHCNFGTEDAAALIAKQLDVPTLLWGPRDAPPLEDGTRLRDSLCGLFATSKVLVKLDVPFTYLPNSAADDPAFEAGFDRFLRTANAASVLRRGCRIGVLGQRIDFFWSTISNESELLERFNVETLPLDLVPFIENVKKRATGKAYADEIAGLREQCVIEEMTDEALARVLAVRDEALELAATHELDAMACQSFMSLPEAVGAWTVYADSLIGDELPFVLESDICGAISTLLLRRAAGSAPFMVDVTMRHPNDDNAVLLWHCGAPLSMKHPDSRVRLGRHWILPGPLSGMTHFRMKDGPITCARFDGDRGRYVLAVGQAESCEGPETQNNYVWARVKNWPRWERTLIEGPFLHHIGMAYGHCGAALREVVKYVPGLELRDMDGGGA